MALYAFFPVMWLATLVAPMAWRSSRAAWPFLLCWAALALGTASVLQWNAVWTTIQTVMTFLLLAAVLRLLASPAGRDEPVAAMSALPA